MTEQEFEEKINAIRIGKKWHCLRSKFIYAQLFKRLRKHGLGDIDTMDILSLALLSGMQEEIESPEEQ